MSFLICGAWRKLGFTDIISSWWNTQKAKNDSDKVDIHLYIYPEATMYVSHIIKLIRQTEWTQTTYIINLIFQSVHV